MKWMLNLIDEKVLYCDRKKWIGFLFWGHLKTMFQTTSQLCWDLIRFTFTIQTLLLSDLKKDTNLLISTIFIKKQIILYVRWINLLYGMLSTVALKFKPMAVMIFSSKMDQGSVKVILTNSAIQGSMKNSIKNTDKYRNDMVIYLFNFIYHLWVKWKRNGSS